MGVEVLIHLFLILALDGGECSASPSGCFTPAERPLSLLSIKQVAGWSPNPSGPDQVGKKNLFPLQGLELRFLGLWRLA
jgi:hypothetical protein